MRLAVESLKVVIDLIICPLIDQKLVINSFIAHFKNGKLLGSKVLPVYTAQSNVHGCSLQSIISSSMIAHSYKYESVTQYAMLKVRQCGIAG